MKTIHPTIMKTALFSFALGVSIGITSLTIGAGTRGADQFSDVPRDSYFDEAAGEMYELGVIRGRPDGTFDPSAYATRAEIAVMMKRLRDEIKGIVATSSTSNTSTTTTRRQTTNIAAEEEQAPRVVTPRNPAGNIHFAIDHFDIEEDAGTATINVVRTGGAEGVVSVQYSLREDTAKAGDDFILTQGELQFADGETNRYFTVRIVNDTLNEGDEVLHLVLQQPSGGADIGIPKEATLTIEDDDGDGPTTSSSSGSSSSATEFSFSALGYSMAENAQQIVVTVNRTGDITKTSSVSYATADDSARAVSDYTQTTGTLTFAANENSKTFTVSLVDDSLTEGNEKVTLRLSAPTGGTLGSPSTVSLTIVDDEVLTFGTGSFRFTESSYTVLESAGKASITIERISGAKGVATVDYKTTNGTAKSGSDYVALDATMTFLAGESIKAVVVNILDDNLNDPSETFQLSLSNPSNGASIGSRPSATLTIQQ